DRLDLPVLWELALAHNPALREAGADVEIARGQLMQARNYPNPRFAYSEDTVGNNKAPPGTLAFRLSQDIVTGGKRRLDVAIAVRGTDAAAMALLGRKFDVLTRIRRGYYEYQSWQTTLRVNQETIAGLEQSVEVSRRLVEQVKTRPRSDLIRL